MLAFLAGVLLCVSTAQANGMPGDGDLRVSPSEYYPLDEIASGEGPRSFAHRILDFESGWGTVTPEMYALLDHLESRARAEISPAVTGGAEERKRVLTAIHKLLTDEGFVYPAEGYVSSLSEGLAPTATSKEETNRLAEQDYNKPGRSALFKKRPNGPFYIADCDILSFIYLDVADAVGIPLRLMERVPRTNADPGHNWVRWETNGEAIDWDPSSGLEYPQGAAIRRPLTDRELVGYLWELAGYHYGVALARHRQRDAYELAIQHGKRASVLNELAWIYATSPDPELRDATRALTLSTQAVQSADDIASYHDTHAAALALAGQFDEALKEECDVISRLGPRAAPADAVLYGYTATLFKRHEVRLQLRETEQKRLSACLGVFRPTQGRAPLSGSPAACFPFSLPTEDPCKKLVRR